ncbi:MAG: hypothetical protein JW709_14300 [Sedimentisphaerales bacterium]|nr:hypothetical protein [Sedimentisphaerales bacterium]
MIYKKILKAFLLIAGALVLSYFTIMMLIYGSLPKWWSERTKKEVLLTEVDYQALLVACQKLMKEHQDGQWSKGSYDMPFDDPEANKLPECILKLDPVHVDIEDDWVGIQMFGRYGFDAYADPNNHLPRGTQIIKGLYFFE